MALSQSSVIKLYKTVIEDVITGVRETFLDEGIDEQVLMELKQIWETKLENSKAVETNPEPIEPQPPILPTQKNSSNKGGGFYSQGSSTAGGSKQQQQQQQQQQQVVNQPTPPQPHPTPALQPATQQPIQQHVNMPIQPVPVQNRINVFERQVPIQITLPGNSATDGKSKVLSIQVPASALQSIQTILSGQVITEAMGFPPDIASRMLQQHVDKMLQNQAAIAPITINQPIQVIRQDQGNIAQIDGQFEESSDDDEDDDDDDNNNDDDEDIDDDGEEEENDDAGAREEEPLNSEDDVTDDDPGDLFDTENVVVCQYDKITRSRNKWKFYLKDGIMNLEGKDYVFQKANGDAEW